MHFQASDGKMCSAEFHRGSIGWRLFRAPDLHYMTRRIQVYAGERSRAAFQAESLQDFFGSGKSISSVQAFG